MLTSKWIWYGLGLVALWVWWHIIRLRNKTQIQRRLRDQQSRETVIPVSESIFVSLLCFHTSVLDAVQVIKHIFDKAYAPHRIFVGICGPVAGIYTKYQSSVQTLPEQDFSDQVRSFVSAETAPNHYAQARHISVTRLYRKEKYFLQLDASCAELVPEWDQLLIENLEQAMIQSPQRPCLLTAPPLYWANDKPRPSFARFGGFATTGPWLQYAAFAAKKLPAPVPALFVSSYFLFCQGPMYVNRNYAVPAQENDAVLSAVLFDTYSLYHPRQAIVTSPTLNTYPFFVAPVPQPVLVHTNPNFLTWAGVDFAHQTAAPTSFIGFNILQTYAEQVQQKFGSWKEYMAELVAWGIEVPQQ